MVCPRALLLAAVAVRLVDGLVPAQRTTVIVDIDDTIKSSGNVRLLDIPLGGIDGQYDRGAFYPGVFDFVFEMAASAPEAPPEPVAVLTARAKEFKFALELDESDKVVTAFREVGAARGRGGWGVAFDRVMYGSVHEWVFQDFKGWVKFRNFEALARALGDLGGGEAPSRRYVFVGDTGELDGQAGDLMLRVHGDICAAVFLHCVGTDPRGEGVDVPPGYDVDGRPVRFFRTYAMAAFHALDLGYIDEAAFDRVCDAALRDCARPDDRNRRADVLRDVEAARSALRSRERQE